MTSLPPLASLDDIRALMKGLPGGDDAAEAATSSREAELTKPAGALGRLEELSAWAASWQGAHPPRADKVLLCVFAGNHGVAARGVSAYPAEVTAQMVQNFIGGGAAINQLCEAADVEMRVYEMALDRPTADFTIAPAMSEEECVQAFTYGMASVDLDADLLCLGEMGIANTTSAAALCAGLFKGKGADWVGSGTGIDARGLARKAQAIDDALACHGAALGDPFEVLRRLGGRELAAITGAVLAARLARVPVLLDGFACTAAAAVLHTAQPTALDHCRVGHVSLEPGHAGLLEKIGQSALLNLNMRLGEGTGAVLALGLVRAAIDCHTGMATFAQAGVSEKED